MGSAGVSLERTVKRPRRNKGEPKFAFERLDALKLTDGEAHLRAFRVVSLVGAEGLEPPTYAL